MHTLIVGLWRNLAQTLPELDAKLADEERDLLARLAQNREARRLIAAVTGAAGLAESDESREMVRLREMSVPEML
ncbi:MAG TPA: hypothetical protein VFM71_00605, partial [Gemmatimonadaceae bacterium]|nr:hypothetical protein [Gemmatimonadaceae bacterium]